MLNDKNQPFLQLQFGLKSLGPDLEVFLINRKVLEQYDEVEVTLSYYPYQKTVKADHFHFDPYEDYVFDLTEGKRSTYQHIHSMAAQSFGILIGATIFSYFFVFYPALLISVESVVSIFAAYTVGKEIWIDVDEALQGMTSSWSIRWVQQSYYYALQQFGTIHRFWQLARQKRYGYQLSLPSQIDFISHSNSKTVEMLFTKKDLRQTDEEKLRVLSITIDDKENITSRLSKGLLIGRVALVKKSLGAKKITEFYQSYDQGQVGTVDMENVWHEGQSLKKKLFSLGRVVFLQKQAEITGTQLISLPIS